jgi:hypothetical protein
VRGWVLQRVDGGERTMVVMHAGSVGRAEGVRVGGACLARACRTLSPIMSMMNSLKRCVRKGTFRGVEYSW